MSNYNPGPREEFARTSENVPRHHTVVENPAVRDGLKVALLEYHRRQTKLSAPDLGGCAACHLRSQGAEEFVELFLNLCETQQASPRVDTTNLASNIKPFPNKK